MWVYWTVSRMPAFAVSRDSPLAKRIAIYLQRMFENGVMERYQLWSDWLIRLHSPTQSDKFVVINIFNVWAIVQIYLVCCTLQCTVFIGELVFNRWQMRRNY